MHAIFDHLTAVLVGTVVLLLVMLTQREASAISIEQQARYGARMQTQGFTDWFERDLLRVGEGLRTGSGGFSLPVQRSDGNTGELVTFRDTVIVRPGTTPLAQRLFTRYRLVAAGTQTVRGAARPLFRLERWVQDRPLVDNAPAPVPLATAWEQEGSSPAILSFLRVDAVGAGDVAAATPAAAWYLRARISLVPPAVQREAALPELHWGTTVGLRPF